MPMTMPHYQKVNDVFSLSDSLPSPAEAHGLICGFICAGNKLDGKSWLVPMLGFLKKLDNDLLEAYKTILLELYEISSIKLQSFEFDFELLIPDDDEPLQVRATALSYWCQGFIVGLNRMGISEAEMITADAKEALNHIIEISKLDYEMIDVNEQDELAYAEVMEYVRMAVLMIYSEIAVEQEKQGGNLGGRQLH